MYFWVKYLNIFFALLIFAQKLWCVFFSIFGLVNRLCWHLEPSSRCLLEIFADQLGLLSLIIVTCNWNQAVFMLFARDLCWSAWRSQCCVIILTCNWNQAVFMLFARDLWWSAWHFQPSHRSHVQLEPGPLHVICSRSLLICLAFSFLSSSSRATGTGPSSRCSLEIINDQLGVLSLVIVLTCNWNQALFTLLARDLCWSAWLSLKLGFLRTEAPLFSDCSSPTDVASWQSVTCCASMMHGDAESRIDRRGRVRRHCYFEIPFWIIFHSVFWLLAITSSICLAAEYIGLRLSLNKLIRFFN